MRVDVFFQSTIQVTKAQNRLGLLSLVLDSLSGLLKLLALLNFRLLASQTE